MNILIAGPWLGEYGYELCKWVPYIRYKVWQDDFDHVIIICRSGHEYLYKDFAAKFYTDNTAGQTTEWLIDSKTPEVKQETIDKILQYYDNPQYTIIQPSKDIRKNEDVFYLMYGEIKNAIEPIDILIHARSTDKYNTGYRNWPKSRWQEIIKKYPDYKFASIGSIDESIHIPKTIDLRGITINKLCGYMKKARLLLSPSSGPAHLASLCGLPHIVWTDDKVHGVIGRHTNKDRYKHLWNPFNTLVSVIDTSWRPSVNDVLERMKSVLNYKKVIKINTNKTIKRRDITKSPIIAMVTYERQMVFKRTIESLEKSNVSLKNFYIFDDYSKNPYKNGYLKSLKKRYKIIQHNQNLGVFVNSLIAIDTCYSMSNNSHIVYCQDDIEFSNDWYNKALEIISKLNRAGIDWGILALLHFKGDTRKDYYIMQNSHPGGACWIVNNIMWKEYRKDHIIYDMEVIGDRLVDHKICHWCHTNEKRRWAVCYAGKSLIKHVGVKSLMHNKDMSKYQGLGYGE